MSEALLAEVGSLKVRTWSRSLLMVLERPAGGHATAIAGVTIREAGPSDAPAYESDIGTDPALTVVKRLSGAGSSCWIAESDGRMVHASWVETEAAWVGEIGRYLVVPAGDAYIYESFTRPEMRGRGVYPAVLATVSEHLGGRGIRRLWIAVESTNQPSLRAIQKAGFIPSFEIAIERRWGQVHVAIPQGVDPGFKQHIPS